MTSQLTIATRESRLALWQAHHVGSLLATQGLGYEIVAITTKGDQILDRSLSKIGSKGVFTEELEAMLCAGEIDIAQHSAKDLPSHLPTELELIAFTEREAAQDVVLSLDEAKTLASSEPLRIGVAWSVQEFENLPADPWDMPLDAILTEAEWIIPETSRCAKER